MENQNNANQDVERVSEELVALKGALSHVIELLLNLSSVVNDGFKEINDRLSILEGKQGMQGVNSQLTETKQELHKIQKAYPYDDLFKNMQTINKTGQA